MSNNSCIICLHENNTYYNGCNKCNNFIICKDCIKKKDTHLIQKCPACRAFLTRIIETSCYTQFIETIYFLRYVGFYIFFILIPSNIMLIDYPHNMESSILITDPFLYPIMINITHLFIIPFIILYYNFFVPILLCLGIINITFLSIFLTRTEQPVTFYKVYNIMYIYIVVYSHLCIIVFSESLSIYKCITNKFINQKNYKIKIYNIYTFPEDSV